MVCIHHSWSSPPSEVPVVTDVKLGVGLSMVLVSLVFFLHSNATWSLHSLWQFIPQSAQARRMHNMSGTGTRVSHRQTDFLPTSLWTLSVLQTRFSELCTLTVKETNSSRAFWGTGEGEKLWFWLQSGFFCVCCFFVFFWCAARFQLAMCSTENHSAPSQHSYASPAPHKTLRDTSFLHGTDWHLANDRCAHDEVP